MKRLFIGVPIFSENATEKVKGWQTDLLLNTNRLSWTKYSNWHITLVFLGQCPEAAVSLLSQIIEQSFGGCPAYVSPLKGVGVFPDKRKPNVIWIGLENIEPLQHSYQLLIDLLLKNDFTLDGKPLKPHLTIARVKTLADRPALNAHLEKYREFNFGNVPIDRVILYESISSPNGVVYQPLYQKMLIKLED